MRKFIKVVDVYIYQKIKCEISTHLSIDFLKIAFCLAEGRLIGRSITSKQKKDLFLISENFGIQSLLFCFW